MWVMEPHPSPVLEEGLSLIVAAHLHVPKGATRASDRGLDKPEVDGEASGRLYPEMAPPSLEPNQGLERDRVWHTMYVTALGLHPDAPALSVPEGLCHLLGRVLWLLVDLFINGAAWCFLRRGWLRVVFRGT